MTKRQTEALAFIKSFIKEHGHSPTHREIADHLGLASKSGVHRIIESLTEQGKVRRVKYRHRTVEVL